ncbi:MAG: GNAT family N-acetyltransferase [Spirochaetes bacterium]|nr:GNAT family N-acetyltransferase [Spirochaetota bacterium]MBU1081106.1 GNAT family N-acetyltransferase [Spirochaetota bacterium]
MIRKAARDDAPRIAEIHVFGWRAAYRGIVPDEILFNRLSVVKRAPSIADALEADEETYVYEDGFVRGWMTIGDCRDEDAKDDFELWGIYVDPLLKRSGVGRALVGFCEDQARARGKRRIKLWVFKDNAPSRSFYEAMGFSTDGKEQLIEKLGAIEIRYQKYLTN